MCAWIDRQPRVEDTKDVRWMVERTCAKVFCTSVEEMMQEKDSFPVRVFSMIWYDSIDFLAISETQNAMRKGQSTVENLNVSTLHRFL
mmetsp:Transcript_13067/g.30797  ORF Transcript_13067/g.30797 Transcript_13067/m.30797 type:complete len:88 (-) Transcript_13067:215-478(-)